MLSSYWKADSCPRDEIHYTAQWSAPSPGGVTRLCADENDKKVRDWFRDQVLALGAEYKVNATGTQIAKFEGTDNSLAPIAMGSHLDSVATGGRFDGPLGVSMLPRVIAGVGGLSEQLANESQVLGGLEVVRSIKEQGVKTHAPLMLINWTNEEGAKFFPPTGSSLVYAGLSTIEEAHASEANSGSGEKMGEALAAIGYVGDGPNTFEEMPISGHFEIHVEQATKLEKAGKPVGWVTGWQGIVYYEITLHGEDGHANTYPMYGRRDTLVGGATVVTELEKLAFEFNGGTTTTNIQSGPVGACNIQSWTKVVFCLLNEDEPLLRDMEKAILTRIKGIASKNGLELEIKQLLDLPPGDFPAIGTDCVRRACGDKGMGAITGTIHDSTMTRLKCPTGMVFVRAKDGISHSAKEWSDKEDCVEGALCLGKAVLNFDQLLKDKAV